MASPEIKKKVLTTAQEIMSYLECSEAMFHKFLSLGMPARRIDNRWYAHTDNIDLFFQRFTMVPGGGKDSLHFEEGGQ